MMLVEGASGEEGKGELRKELQSRLKGLEKKVRVVKKALGKI